ncbi:MAG: hypothetical protein QN174_09770 [Armatimonadota bacterium]|nr:hypothetical protein [Armatimonadota bacterium]MDR7457050.1 hypothetical protein [Armatimonadota bacterium]MDR7497232.1 hypothetical protein [Armatimonadota bacterium]MDR7511936.1 hypothetical protein [Armatimonadota bacterium]
MRTPLLWVGIAALAVAGLTTLAAAKAADTAVFRATYGSHLKEGSDLARALPCLVCHDKMPATKTGLNPYGVDVGKAAAGKTLDAKVLAAVERLDSDKDGFSNIDEIRAGTHPGNPNSKPRK